MKILVTGGSRINRVKGLAIGLLLSLALLVSCVAPTMPETSPSTTEEPLPTDVEESASSAELIQLRTDLENAQVAYQDLLRVRKAETDDLTHRLSVAKQQLDDSHAEYGTLWDIYQSLAVEKTRIERENIALREDAYSKLRDLQSMSLKLQTELDCLHTNWTRTRMEYELLNREGLPAGRFMIPNEDEYKEAYENLQGEYSKLHGAAESLLSGYELWYTNTNYLGSDLDFLLSALNEIVVLISQLKEVAK